jgi:tetratricopeptide (TPR) repeat protein
MRTMTYEFVLRLGVCALTLAASGQAQSVAGARDTLIDSIIARASSETAREPGRDAAWTALGDAFMQKARETADGSYYARAEAAYRKALELNPKGVDALVGLAWVEGGRHEFEASIEWARKALAIDAKCAAAYGLVGDAALEMGDYDAAFDQYQKMLDARPGLASYGRSAHLLHLTGDTRRATMLMSKAIQAGGSYAENTAWCRAQLALMYFSEGAYLPAKQLLEEGLRLRPGDYRLLAAMGKVLAAMKEYKAAIGYYARAVTVAPQQDFVAALGDLYALTGQSEEAKHQYALVESIARINKANGVKGDLGTARFYADHDLHLDRALQLAQLEYKTRPNVYTADTLAWACFKSGDLENAGKYIALALKQNTPEAQFSFHKGMICAKAGDKVAARQALYEALSLNPNFDPLQAPVAIEALRQLGEHGAGESVAAAR